MAQTLFEKIWDSHLVERRGDLDGDRLGDAALAGEPVALADEVRAELHLVHDRGRRHRPGEELHAARRAAPAPSARGGDVDRRRVGGLEDRRPRRHLELPAARCVYWPGTPKA